MIQPQYKQDHEKLGDTMRLRQCRNEGTPKIALQLQTQLSWTLEARAECNAQNY